MWVHRLTVVIDWRGRWVDNSIFVCFFCSNLHVASQSKARKFIHDYPTCFTLVKSANFTPGNVGTSFEMGGA